LMSADTRETCEALGRSVDIDHLRPEVREAERGAVVKRIKDTGAVVAVLGHWPFDDEPLGEADVSVALAAAAKGTDDFSVSLVSDDVRSAALALALARQTRVQAVQVLALVLAPAVVGSLLITAFPSLLPPEYAPLALLLGTIAAVLQLRKSDGRSVIR
jgi:P-type Cu+ transporter